MEIKPDYKLTEVGVIPDDWSVDCVGNSFIICNELRKPISQSVRKLMSGPYPYYGPTDIQDWINEYRVDGKYALIGEDGDHFLKWQNQPMTLLVKGKFNVNNHAHLVRGNKNLTEWFYWFFSHRDLTLFLTRQGAGRYKLTKATLLQIPCALPSPEEQRAIAAALSDVDALLDGLDRLIAKKRDLKQAAMQQLLAGQTRLPGFSGEWDQIKLDELFSFKNGLNKAKEFFGYGTPIVNYMDVFASSAIYPSKLDGRVSLSNAELKNFDVKKGDVFFTRTSETIEEVGIAAVMLDDPIETVFSGFVLRARPLNERLNDEYKAYCFRSDFVRKQITSPYEN